MHNEHSEYREEIPHGDHPLSFDHSEPRSRAIAIYMTVTVIFLGLIGIGIQNYYDLVVRKRRIFASPVSAQLAITGPSQKRAVGAYPLRIH